MKSSVQSLPLYPWLPMIISLLLIIMVMADRWLSYQQVMLPREKERQTLMLNQISNRMWLQVSSLMMKNNLSETENYLTSFISNSGFRVLALTDNEQIILANRFALKGQAVSGLNCYLADRVLTMRQENRVVVYPIAENELCAFIPIPVSSPSPSIRPTSTLFLLVEYNLEPAIKQLRDEAFHASHFARGFLFALIAGLVLTLLISQLVLRPIRSIQLTMKKFSRGDEQVRTHLSGQGELAELANHFNEIADQLNLSKQQLQDNERRWIYALDAAGDGVWDWDARQNKVFYSEQWKKMLGYENSEISTQPEEWSERLHPDDREQAITQLTDHLKGKSQIYRNEHRLRCKNGEYRWVLNRGMVFKRDDQGHALRILGTHSDITEQKQIQQALSESQQRFELAMQGAADGLWDWKIDSHQVYFSPRWKQMLGYKDHELKNEFSSWEKLVHKSDLPAAQRELQQCISGKKQHYEAEFRMQHREGHWVYILSRAIVVYSQHHRVERLVGTHVDITEIRQVQAQLEESQKKLEKLAFYDALTGLPNRRLLEDRLLQYLAKARRQQELTAIVMMDLDGFKQVNDNLGHDIGDQLLKEVAERLKNCIREIDTVARLGGDEFVFILGELKHRDDAILILERVLHSVALPCILSEQTCHVSASIGVSFYPDHGESGDLLLRQSDIAMYSSKKNGRNQIRFYQPDTDLLK